MTTQLYHLPSLDLPDLPDRPSREQALAALALLTGLLSEFSFVGPLDRAVALAGILTVLVRGSLQTAPMYIVRAHTPGTGKSYLVDVISAIATGRLCPVITASKSEEETEKRLGESSSAAPRSSRSTIAITTLAGRCSANLPSGRWSRSASWGAARCRSASATRRCSQPATMSCSRATWSGAGSSVTSTPWTSAPNCARFSTTPSSASSMTAEPTLQRH